MPIKNVGETYKHITEMGRSNDYMTGTLLSYEYFPKHYKLIAIDLSKEIELENADLKQQINLEGLEEMKEQQCFSSLKSQKRQLWNFHKMLQQWFDFDYV